MVGDVLVLFGVRDWDGVAIKVSPFWQAESLGFKFRGPLSDATACLERMTSLTIGVRKEANLPTRNG
jgi:hypothetical protein